MFDGGPVIPREVIGEDTLCIACSFNLRAFPTAGFCPQCRTPIERTLRGVSDGVVVQERTCVRCGYSLRGLPHDGTCPECSTPVGLSLRGPLLYYSDAGYLRTLHAGVVLGELGIALKVVATVG